MNQYYLFLSTPNTYYHQQMNPLCFGCSSPAFRVCVHPQCSSPPFFCTSECNQGLTRAMHIHNGLSSFISFQEFQNTTSDIKAGLHAPTYYKSNLQQMKKRIVRIQDSLMEEVKRLNEVFEKFERDLCVNLQMKLTVEVQEVMQKVSEDFQGKSLSGGDLSRLLKHGETFAREKQTLMFVECLKKDLNQELDKMEGIEFDIKYIDWSERIKSSQRLFQNGKELMANNKSLEALEKFKESITFNSCDYTLYLFTAHCLYHLDNLDQAEQYYKKSLEMNPNNSSTLNNLGGIYERRNDFKEAVKYYSMAVEKDQRNIGAVRNRGDCFANLGMYEEAMQDYLKCSKMEPGNQEYVEALAEVVGLMKERKR